MFSATSTSPLEKVCCSRMEDVAAGKGTSSCFHGLSAVFARAIRGKRPEVAATGFVRMRRLETWSHVIESLPEYSAPVE
jgi:hypothetical protein